jgi:hypothetical protein
MVVGRLGILLLPKQLIEGDLLLGSSLKPQGDMEQSSIGSRRPRSFSR